MNQIRMNIRIIIRIIKIIYLFLLNENDIDELIIVIPPSIDFYSCFYKELAGKPGVARVTLRVVFTAKLFPSHWFHLQISPW